MTYYAQTNYQQLQGISGRYRIYDIGCFLTAFCNLELDYNKTIDPLTLNNFFRDNSIFIDVDDGIRDDVDWSFIQRWDSETRVDQLGAGGWPNSNQSIVKFLYTSPRSGEKTTHFCKVYDYVNQQIVDSWDGQVKHISSTVYGQPIAWAIYQHSPVQSVTVPAPVHPCTYEPTAQVNKLTKLQPTNWYNLNSNTTDPAQVAVVTQLNAGTTFTVGGYAHHIDGHTYVMTPDDFNRAQNGDYGTNNGIEINDLKDVPPIVNPAPSVINTPTPTVPVAEKYTLVTTLVYFPTAEDAKQRTPKALGPVFEGTYYVVGRDAQAVKLSKDNKSDIGWINTNDNRLPIPEPVIAVPTLPVDPPKVVTEPVNVNPAPIVDIAPAKKDIPWNWLNADHSPTVYRYKGTMPVPIRDLEGSKPPLTMNAGLQGPISRFTEIQGRTYLIPDSEFKKGNAYGINEQLMEPVNPPNFLQEAEHDLETWGKFLESGFKSTARLITDISPVKISQVSVKIKQSIDGFNSKRKDK